MQELAISSMRKQFLILAAAFFLISAKAQVSNVHLSFGATGVLHPDTVQFGDNLSFSFWLVNKGNLPLNSLIDIHMDHTDSSMNNTMYLGSFADNDTLLEPNDSIWIVTWDYLSPQAYVGGDNIVVIWPNAFTPFPLTTDEYLGSIYVYNNVNTLEYDAQDFTLYPNPISSNSVLSIPNNVNKVSFRLINILGKVIKEEYNVQQNFIAISSNGLKAGMYFVELHIGKQIITKQIIIK